MTEIADTEDFVSSIAGAVRAELGRQGKRRSELAAVLGLSRPTVYGRLNGRTPFTSQELDQVARFLNISAYDLIQSAEMSSRFTATSAAPDPVARDPFAQPARAKRGAA